MQRPVPQPPDFGPLNARIQELQNHIPPAPNLAPLQQRADQFAQLLNQQSNTTRTRIDQLQAYLEQQMRERLAENTAVIQEYIRGQMRQRRNQIPTPVPTPPQPRPSPWQMRDIAMGWRYPRASVTYPLPLYRALYRAVKEAKATNPTVAQLQADLGSFLPL
jgi:hypothetical protein